MSVRESQMPTVVGKRGNACVFVSDRVLEDKEWMKRLMSFTKATGSPGRKVAKGEETPSMLERPVWKRPHVLLSRDSGN